MLPPNVKPCWEDNGAQVQALILAFDEFRSLDEFQWEAEQAGAKAAPK